MAYLSSRMSTVDQPSSTTALSEENPPLSPSFPTPADSADSALNRYALRWLIGGSAGAVLGLLLDLVWRGAEPLWLASWLFFPGVLVAVMAYLFLFYPVSPVSELRPIGRSEPRIHISLWLLATLVSLLAVGIFTEYHAGLEKYIAFWDSASYRKYSMFFLISFWDSPLHSLGGVYSSILEDEYNNLPTLLIAPGLKTLGYAFPGYVMAIYLLFLAPAAWQSSWLLRSLGRDLAPNQSSFVDKFAGLMLLALPPVLVPMCNGMLDAVGLPFAFTLVMAMRQDAFRKWPYWKLAMLIPVIVALAFTRRWYGIWIGGYFGAVAVMEVTALAFEYPMSFKSLIRTGLAAATMLGGAALIWFVFFREFLDRSLFNDYAESYKAYQFGDLEYDLNMIVGHISWLWTGLCLVGLVFGLRNPATRRFTLFSTFSLLIAATIHLRINNFSWHHFYMLVGQLAVLGFLGLVGIRKLPYGKWLAIAVMALLAANWLQVLGTNPPAWPKAVKVLLSDSRVPPRQRHDLDNLYALDHRLKEICDPLGLKVYVVASSFVFNEDMLRNIGLPEVMYSGLYLAGVHSQVDRRDPFPEAFILADVVVLALPIQYHLEYDDQRIVGYLAEGLTDSAGIGRHYRTITEFSLDEGVKAVILQKKEAWTMEDASALAERFRKAYPAYPAMANVNMLEASTFNRHQPPSFGMAQWRDGGKTLALHPGGEAAAGLSLKLQKPADSLSFQARFSNPCARGAEVVLDVLADGQSIYKEYLQAIQPVGRISLPVRGVKVVRIEVSKGNKKDYCDELHLEEFRME